MLLNCGSVGLNFGFTDCIRAECSSLLVPIGLLVEVGDFFLVLL